MDSHSSIEVTAVLVLVVTLLSTESVVSEVTIGGDRLSFGLIVSTSTLLATAEFLRY